MIGITPLLVAARSRRVFRGGGWDYLALHCRSAVRLRVTPDYSWYVLGFRLALSSE